MEPLAEHEDTLSRALRHLEDRTSFAEALAERSGGFAFRLDTSTTRAESSPRIEGVVFRAWDGKRWSETASASLEPAAVGRCVDSLRARLSSSAIGSQPPGEPTKGRAEQVMSLQRASRDVAPEERERLARSWFSWATSVPGIKNAVASIGEEDDERLYVSTFGAFRYQRVSRIAASVVPLAIENGKVEYDGLVEGRLGGFETLEGVITEDAVTAVAKDALALLGASSPPTGTMAVLMDPSTSGTFAHESFGHGTEADQLLRNRSYLKPILGEVVAPEILSLVDDGSLSDGYGTIYFDDEGRATERTTMVDHGRFVEVLHNRESAAQMGRRPRGNTRRSNFLGRPFVRMTNTFVEPGNSSYDELVKETRDGVLLQHCTSGIEDPLGGQMQIKVKKARRIERGELTTLHSSMALSGRVLDVLRSVRGVSRKEDFAMTPGACGKGHSDPIPVATGGTYLLVHAVVGPA
ncbi:MAG: TldD/PmbA family protein [Thermoplasmata archaeon]